MIFPQTCNSSYSLFSLLFFLFCGSTSSFSCGWISYTSYIHTYIHHTYIHTSYIIHLHLKFHSYLFYIPSYIVYSEMSSNPESSDSIDHLHLSQNSHVIVIISLFVIGMKIDVSFMMEDIIIKRDRGSTSSLIFLPLSFFFHFHHFLSLFQGNGKWYYSYVYKFTGGLSRIPFTYSLSPSFMIWMRT